MEPAQLATITQKRHRGRPAGANAELQRQRILQHACDAFAENGPDSTRLQDIAERAGVDRRLVYHYFKSKERLYLEVLQDIFSKLVDLSEDIAIGQTDLESVLAQLMQRYYHFCRTNTAYVRLLMWENLREAQGLKQYAEKCEMIRHNFEFMKPLILNAARDGRCRIDIDPTLLVLTCLGQCLYFLSHGASLELFFHCDATSDQARDTWINHALIQVIDGIRPR
ncbi:TetR/AcrR family transcriptional regulator [Planctomycetota bacterium]|nr:TetR/AcrR family transcriptional regulator [Planctomycetota bacterium]